MTREKDLIESERTELRPFSASDADELLSLFQVPEVRRYLLDDALVSADWMREEIETSQSRFASSGAGLWSIRLQGDPVIIGFAGFREFFDPPQLQLLYGLRPDYWGRGLATEAARRVCDHAFRELGFPQIAAATDLPNEASARVLRRLGMTLYRTTDEGPRGTAFYVLGRDPPLTP